jgi:hypothetical protein
MPVNRVQVTVANVKNVPLVNPVNPRIKTRLRAPHATRATIKKRRAKRRVCLAFLECMKMIRVRSNAKLVAKDNIKAYRATTRVWIAQLANT